MSRERGSGFNLQTAFPVMFLRSRSKKKEDKSSNLVSDLLDFIDLMDSFGANLQMSIGIRRVLQATRGDLKSP